ncbi:MAG: MBL fold hydrolase [Bacteroidetes bacterium MED-G17]|nr:MAG: MBL fold hydrolase [Bacteroidetes bacterium MED-G17]CAI8317611.1 MAG: Hydroxyacylglutathione hydrolase GloC [Bacteroidetes bacterium MED-G17]
MLRVKSFSCNPFQENTFLIYNEIGQAVVIDPGMSNAYEEDMFSNFVHEKNLKLTQMVNTHCHIDHILGVSYIHEIYGLSLYFHPKEQVIWDMAIATAHMYSLPYNNHIDDVKYITEEETIQLSGEQLEIIFTPGHSPGSISFYCPKNNWAIVGDTLFKQSIGRTDLPMGNHIQLINSIKDRLLSLPMETKVYCGHGESTIVSDEKKRNPYLLT